MSTAGNPHLPVWMSHKTTTLEKRPSGPRTRECNPSVYPNAGLWRHLVGPTGHRDAPRHICLTRNGGAEDREQKVTGPKAIGRYPCAAHTGTRAAASPYPAAGLFYRGPQHSAGAPYHPPATVERPLWPRGLVVCAVSSPRPRALETGGRVRVGGGGRGGGTRGDVLATGSVLGRDSPVSGDSRANAFHRVQTQAGSPTQQSGGLASPVTLSLQGQQAGQRRGAPAPLRLCVQAGSWPFASARPALCDADTHVARCKNPVRCIPSKRQGDIRPPKK